MSGLRLMDRKRAFVVTSDIRGFTAPGTEPSASSLSTFRDLGVELVIRRRPGGTGGRWWLTAGCPACLSHAARSAGVRPPQMPSSVAVASANARQSSRTGQPRQMALARRTVSAPPRSGKNHSVGRPAQAARSAQRDAVTWAAGGELGGRLVIGWWLTVAPATQRARLSRGYDTSTPFRGLVLHGTVAVIQSVTAPYDGIVAGQRRSQGQFAQICRQAH
jgi:hypothetical protein